MKTSIEQARATVSSRRRPASFGDAGDTNVAQAEELWQSRATWCRRTEGFDEALSRAMDRLAR